MAFGLCCGCGNGSGADTTPVDTECGFTLPTTMYMEFSGFTDVLGGGASTIENKTYTLKNFSPAMSPGYWQTQFDYVYSGATYTNVELVGQEMHAGGSGCGAGCLCDAFVEIGIGSCIFSSPCPTMSGLALTGACFWVRADNGLLVDVVPLILEACSWAPDSGCAMVYTSGTVNSTILAQLPVLWDTASDYKFKFQGADIPVATCVDNGHRIEFRA